MAMGLEQEPGYEEDARVVMVACYDCANGLVLMFGWVSLFYARVFASYQNGPKRRRQLKK